jgi:putative inorganic carbon (hco3(-)) transporter
MHQNPLNRMGPSATVAMMPDALTGGTGLRSIAFALFMVLVVFTLLNMPSRIPVLGVVRPTILLVALISVLIMASLSQVRTKDTSKTTRYLNLLILYVVLTLPFVEWPGSVLRFGIEGFVKVAVFFYFAVYLVDSYQRLRIFIFTFLACQVIRVLEPLYLHLTTGYWGSRAHMGGVDFMDRLAGAPHDIINPNGLAFVVLTALPFLHYLLGGSPKIVARLLYVALLPPILYAFILTGSRSGMVGLLVLYGIIMLRSRHKLLLGAAAALATVALLGVMSADLSDRYRSITDADTRHAATAQGRLSSITGELRVGLERPLLGHGLGTSREALANVAGRDQIAHNLYTEVFIELGAIGLAIYLLFLFSVFINVRSVGQEQRRLRDAPHTGADPPVADRLAFYQRLADATLVYFLMALVFSLASYGLSNHYWYMVAGLSVALRGLMVRERWHLERRQRDPIPPPPQSFNRGSASLSGFKAWG